MKYFLFIYLLLLTHSIANASTPPGCELLQDALFDLSNAGGGTHTLSDDSVICNAKQNNYMNTDSSHGLIVPEHVTLDLNGGTIQLSLTGGDDYGIRLASNAAIKNGTISLIESSNSGLQTIWHSAISVGAAYGHGGTSDNPSYFSNIGYWSISNININQPYDHAGIQIASEAHHGLIENIRIYSSEEAVVGIGIDWGSVGDFSSEDNTMTNMREGWLAGDVYTTHPHHITINNIVIENFTKQPKSENSNEDYAAIRVSAGHAISMSNITINEAWRGIIFRGGDVGYEFAQDSMRAHAHKAIRLENFTIYNAHDQGVIIDGLADNATVWRSNILNNIIAGVFINGVDFAPDNAAIINNDIYLNTPHIANQIKNINGTNITQQGNQLNP
ncbi:hypothetical protein A9Q99_20550 [Gammaproteobacteria bacterium 45_16_T64]|nr:hypothetical protein A9Q99_20550 [Gammaproteobacteria bacterium 45_16_T64]